MVFSLEDLICFKSIFKIVLIDLDILLTKRFRDGKINVCLNMLNMVMDFGKVAIFYGSLWFCI